MKWSVALALVGLGAVSFLAGGYGVAQEPPAPNPCPPVHWGYAKLVSPNTDVNMDYAPGPMTWGSQLFPYTVPAGKWLAITDIQLHDKVHVGGALVRGNYFVVSNIGSAMTQTPLQFKSPVVIPPGATLHFNLINNSTEGQWMLALMAGYLSDYADLRECSPR